MPAAPSEGRLLSCYRACAKSCEIAAARSLNSLSPCSLLTTIAMSYLPETHGDDRTRGVQRRAGLPLRAVLPFTPRVEREGAAPPRSCRMCFASMITWQVLYELVQMCKAATLDYRNRLEKYKAKPLSPKDAGESKLPSVPG